MAKWADFSGPPPGAKALKAAGYTGVIRYIGLGSEGKQIHAAEYQDYVREGLEVLLVAELTISDAWAALDDYATGVARAQLALEDARAEGIPDSVPIAWAADSHATTSQVQDAIKYGRGFQAVLGARSGAYGFMETLRAVRAAGVASWYWLAGSKPSQADQEWVNFWQHNDRTETVNRTVCDVNEGYAPMGPHILEDNMPLTPNDGNVKWKAVDIDVSNEDGTPHVEEWELATWVAFAAYRTARIQAEQQRQAAVQGQILAAVTGGAINQDQIVAALREGAEKAIEQSLIPALRAAIPDIEDATISKIRTLLTPPAPASA